MINTLKKKILKTFKTVL